MVWANAGSKWMTALPFAMLPAPKSSIQFSGDCIAYVSTVREPPAETSDLSCPVQLRLPPPTPQAPFLPTAMMVSNSPGSRAVTRPVPPVPALDTYRVDQLLVLLFRN